MRVRSIVPVCLALALSVAVLPGSTTSAAPNPLKSDAPPAPGIEAHSEPAPDGAEHATDWKAAPPGSPPRLADGTLQEAVEAAAAGQPVPPTVDIVGDSIRVEAFHAVDSEDARRAIESVGGTFEGEVDGLIQALVPIDRLAALEATPEIDFVRSPPDEPVVQTLREPTTTPDPGDLPVITGEEVAKVGADAWHAAGITGENVKVGIIDSFRQAEWSSAQAAGEVPAPAGTFCVAPCSVWTTDFERAPRPGGCRGHPRDGTRRGPLYRLGRRGCCSVAGRHRLLRFPRVSPSSADRLALGMTAQATGRAPSVAPPPTRLVWGSRS